MNIHYMQKKILQIRQEQKHILRKGDTVNRQITDANGKVRFDNLHIGDYQIKETKEQ